MNFSEDLKNAVLQMALQGKLTKQLETDSSVNDLISRISTEKNILAGRKKTRADKDFGPIQEDEIEFDIPKNWEWIRVSNIGVYKKGPFGSKLTKSLFVPKSKNTVKVFEQKNAIKKDASLGNYYITEEYYNSEMKGFSVEPGDIIVSCAGTIGETYVLPNNIEKGIINQALMRMNIVDSINLDFFLYYFDHILKKSANKASNGSAIKNIPPFDIFKAMLFPLPPIEEQQRIVEKLNQILPLIDEYGKEEDELITLCQKFPEEMKKSVLQSAMQGKLTKQLETDSSVDELLKKNGISVSEDSDVIDIPESWKYVKLENLVSLPIKRGKAPKYVTKSSVLVFAQKCNQKYGPISMGKALYLNEDLLKRYNEEDFVKANDIVINSTGGGTMGRVGFVEPTVVDIPEKIVPDTHVTLVRANTNIILERYLYTFCKSMQPTMESLGVGSTNQTELRPEIISNLNVPLPPIEEQQRIVEKLNTILPIIDSMAVYGTKKKAGRPKQEEALAFISSLLGTKKSTVSKPVTPEITELTSKEFSC